MFSPTEEQEACKEALKEPQSLMIKAFAGCSKTTTLQYIAPDLREATLALAFNKRIEQELRPRLPEHFQVKTLNGLGHGIWARRPNMPRLEIDSAKITKLIKQVTDETSARLSSAQWTFTQQMIQGAITQGLVPRGIPAEICPLEDEYQSWADIADDRGVPRDEIALTSDIAREVLRRDIALAERGIISFDDQIYCPTLLGGPWPQFPVVMADEAQDLSPMNRLMIQRALRREGRAIIVGDPLQSVYAFRGADHQSFENLRQLSNAWKDLKLTLTFRCPKLVVERNAKHAQGFRAAQANKDGEVIRRLGQESIEDEWSWDSEALLAQAREGEIAILCRNNGPLMSLAFKLLRQGVGVRMAGRDIGKGLQALSKKIAKEDSTPRAQLISKICDWRDREVESALAQEKESLAESARDRAECLLAVLDSGGASTAGDLRKLLEMIFARESGRLLLSSIHRAKGLEWNTVVHLDAWRIPSKWAKKKAAAGDSRDLIQEMNLLYVCETRTKDLLVMANLEDFR